MAVAETVKKAAEKVEPIVKETVEKAQPMIAKATEAAAPAVSKAKSATKAATAAAKETVEKVEKKAASRSVKTSVVLELGEVKATVAAIEKAVKEDVKAKGLKAKDLQIYINTAEKAAYYTVDGIGSPEYKVLISELA